MRRMKQHRDILQDLEGLRAGSVRFGEFDVGVFLQRAAGLYSRFMGVVSRRVYSGMVGRVLRGLGGERRVLEPGCGRYVSPLRVHGWELVGFNRAFVEMLWRRFGDLDSCYDGYNTMHFFEGWGIKLVDYDERTLEVNKVRVEGAYRGLLFGAGLYPGAHKVLFEDEGSAYMVQAGLYSVGCVDIEAYAAGDMEGMLVFVERGWDGWLAPNGGSYSLFRGLPRVLASPRRLYAENYRELGCYSWGAVARLVRDVIYRREYGRG